MVSKGQLQELAGALIAAGGGQRRLPCLQTTAVRARPDQSQQRAAASGAPRTHVVPGGGALAALAAVALLRLLDGVLQHLVLRAARGGGQ